MNALTLLLIEIAASVAIAFATSRYLRPTLSDCLELLCGSPQNRRFWLSFIHLMLLIVPLLCVMVFSTPQDIRFDQWANALRAGLLQILLGIFIALLAVGWNVWRFAQADKAARLTPQPTGMPGQEA